MAQIALPSAPVPRAENYSPSTSLKERNRITVLVNSVAGTNAMTKSDLGERRFLWLILPGCRPSLTSEKESKHSSKNWSRERRRTLLPGLFSGLLSCLSYITRPPLPRDGTTAMVFTGTNCWALHTISIINQDNLSQTCSQATLTVAILQLRLLLFRSH